MNNLSQYKFINCLIDNKKIHFNKFECLFNLNLNIKLK